MDLVRLQKAPTLASAAQAANLQELCRDGMRWKRRHSQLLLQGSAQELHFGVESRVQFCRRSLVSIYRTKHPAVLCSQNGGVATETDSANIFLSDQDLAIKKKGQEVVDDLKGTCIFLIGMMGSGKTTVGKIVSDGLGYFFFDSDKLVEEAAGGSVAQIFKDSHEEGFRDAESEVLSQLSSMCRLVVATGGGAVVRPKNWGYLRHGITVWLDVPLEALAKRVVAAGTEKRPLLGEAAKETAHSQALARLTKLYEERGQAYANADITVSVQKIASEMGIDDLQLLTPTIIALKVLEQTQKLIRSQKTYGKPRIGL